MGLPIKKPKDRACLGWFPTSSEDISLNSEIFTLWDVHMTDAQAAVNLYVCFIQPGSLIQPHV